ncbi:MAG: multicopper oxidase family protein [Chloroflexia bacterium]
MDSQHDTGSHEAAAGLPPQAARGSNSPKPPPDTAGAESHGAHPTMTGMPTTGPRMPRVPAWQVVAATLVTLLLLGTGLAVAAAGGDLSMRPGMAGTTMGTPGNGGGMPGMSTAMPTSAMAGGAMAGQEMSAVDVSNAPAAPANARGMQLLTSTLVSGVKEFHLMAGVIRWHILPNVEVGAYAYNQQVPGPLIRVTEGDRVRIVVRNDLPEPTTIHWHGLQLPNDQDGAGSMTQQPIAPGTVYTYSFTVPATPGTFFYHTHVDADRQQALGLYAPLIIDAAAPTDRYDVEYTVMLQEWMVSGGQTYPAMDMAGRQPNFFTINGKSWPATERLKVKVGQRVLLRFIGSGQFIHPMHLHGQPFEIVATDGNPVPLTARIRKDTVLVGPGERYDVAFTARAPGLWLLHCHINHHLTNDGREEQGAGGLTMVVQIDP